MPRKVKPRRSSIYLSERIHQEIEREATRLDRNVSWLIRMAWDNSREAIKALPSHGDMLAQSAPKKRKKR